MRSKSLHTAVVLSLAASLPAAAQSWRPPERPQRCPSRWGANDQRGAANHVKPASVARAARLIRTGEMFELGRTLSAEMVFFGSRRFDLHLKRTAPLLGTNRRGSNEEIVTTELGQVGTQLDMFPHQTIGDETYN